MSMVEQVLGVVCLAAAVAILSLVAISALVLLCFFIYDAWLNRKWDKLERERETK